MDTRRVFPLMLLKFPSVILQKLEEPPTSSLCNLQLEVNTTQDPSQDFEIKLEDAVNCVHRNGKRGDLTQTVWVTVGLRFSPCYWWKEIMTAVASPAARAGGVGEWNWAHSSFF